MVPWHLQPKYTSGRKTPAEEKAAGVLAEQRAARVQAKKQEKRQKKKVKEAQREITEGRDSLGSRECLPAHGVVGKRVEKLQDFGGLMETPQENSDPVTAEQESPSLLMEPGLSRLSKKAELESTRQLEMVEQSVLEELEPKPASRLEPKLAGMSEELEPKSNQALGTSSGCDCNMCEPKAELSELGYTTYQRYYHVFREGELVGLVQRVGELRVQEEFYDHENWCVLAAKLNNNTC